MAVGKPWASHSRPPAMLNTAVFRLFSWSTSRNPGWTWQPRSEQRLQRCTRTSPGTAHAAAHRMATPQGNLPTAISRSLTPWSISITDTLASPPLETKTRLPSGCTVMPLLRGPALIFASPFHFAHTCHAKLARLWHGWSERSNSAQCGFSVQR
jgi:hypothetical protein